MERIKAAAAQMEAALGQAPATLGQTGKLIAEAS
jgi:hypothetical protein